ncbi:unnamed protein product [Spirodela intermedia]|uniref:Uncharacterized protein n=1 Tax=Spirodela intermedia TaxID=51605 RepID=A0A7I8KZE9_SPIIN|nr:unnamed protein product [Spirodela intermedia]
MADPRLPSSLSLLSLRPQNRNKQVTHDRCSTKVSWTRWTG